MACCQLRAAAPPPCRQRALRVHYAVIAVRHRSHPPGCSWEKAQTVERRPRAPGAPVSCWWRPVRRISAESHAIRLNCLHRCCAAQSAVSAGYLLDVGTAVDCARPRARLRTAVVTKQASLSERVETGDDGAALRTCPCPEIRCNCQHSSAPAAAQTVGQVELRHNYLHAHEFVCSVPLCAA
jgi:hypothetical protein